MDNLDYDIEKAAVEKQMSRLLAEPKVRQAMKLRCEETAHDFEGACSVTLQVYMVCRWCGEKG